MERRTLLVGMLWDLGLPIAVYYLCRGLGVGPVPALLAGGGAALLRVAAVALRKRRLDGVAALVAAGFAVMGGLFLLGDEHLMLAKESIMSGGLGLVLLVSCLIGRPLMYAALRRVRGDDPKTLAAWDDKWANSPEFRSRFTGLSLVWGIGLLVEALVRLPVIFALPADVGYPVSVLLQFGTIAALLWFTVRSGKAARRAATVES